jgi:DNA-binding transcriptional regulator PaaX
MSITKEVLKILAEGLGVVEFVSDFRYVPYKMIWGDLGGGYDKEAFRVAVSRAVKKGLVKKKIDEEQVYLSLTQLGIKYLEKSAQRPALEIKHSAKKWDGKYRLIIFDIPEEKRTIRDLLRSKLKEFGCVGWQKSVWVTKEDVTKIVLKFIEENSLEDYILVLETDAVNNKKLEKTTSLKQKLNLSVKTTLPKPVKATS